MDADTIIIGSGAGGLAAAVALARAAQRVIELKRHHLPGGWCHSFQLEGCCFSPGVHYLGELRQGGLLRRILAPHLRGARRRAGLVQKAHRDVAQRELLRRQQPYVPGDDLTVRVNNLLGQHN